MRFFVLLGVLATFFLNGVSMAHADSACVEKIRSYAADQGLKFEGIYWREPVMPPRSATWIHGTEIVNELKINVSVYTASRTRGGVMHRVAYLVNTFSCELTKEVAVFHGLAH